MELVPQIVYEGEREGPLAREGEAMRIVFHVVQGEQDSGSQCAGRRVAAVDEATASPRACCPDNFEEGSADNNMPA